MLDAGYVDKLNRVLASLEDRIELSPAERLIFFHPDPNMPLPRQDERRRFSRLPLRQKAVLSLRQTLPAIKRERAFHCVYVRDISRTGIGFLHADELFPGEECQLWLPQKQLRINVVLCRRQGPRCYVIGAQFPRG